MNKTIPALEMHSQSQTCELALSSLAHIPIVQVVLPLVCFYFLYVREHVHSNSFPLPQKSNPNRKQNMK